MQHTVTSMLVSTSNIELRRRALCILNRLPHVECLEHPDQLKSGGHYDDVLGRLVSILESNRALDRDQELARRIAAQRAC